MIELRRAKRSQLALFSEMEQDDDTSPYILPTTLEQHRQAFALDDIIYLSIFTGAEPGRFIILALDPDARSVELRRIVVAHKGRGTGGQAIAALESFCRTQLQRSRIWLDAYDFNRRGQRLYCGLGYIQFDQRDFEGNQLLFFEKEIVENGIVENEMRAD